MLLINEKPNPHPAPHPLALTPRPSPGQSRYHPSPPPTPSPPPPRQVRAGITKQISSLNDKLDIWRTLASPRDNAYIRYDLDAATPPIRAALHGYGRLHTSTTFPAMSHVRMVGGRVTSHPQWIQPLTLLDICL